MKKEFDLIDRTREYGIRSIQFSRSVPASVITNPLIHQFIRSATSVGANYCEADQAQTKKDFIHKICLCKKESRESMYWIEMIMAASPLTEQDGKILWQESKELTLIFNTIVKTAKQNDNN